MGGIGSTEMYLIWDKFGITAMSSGLILITGSTLNRSFSNPELAEHMKFKENSFQIGLESVIRMSPEDITVIPNFSQITYISVLPIRPIF